MDTARQFSIRLAELLRDERSAMAEFLVALSQFDRDRGWLALDYTSLFQYLERELKLTAGPAFYRMTAARLIQEHPEMVEPLRDGRLCLSTVGELSKVLTRENISTVLPRFFGVSRQEAREIAAELSPREVPARTVVTAVRAPDAAAEVLPRRGPACGPASAVDEGRAAALPLLPVEVRPEPPLRPPDSARAQVEPKTADLSRMHVTVTRRLVEKLAAARDALSHSRPDATDDEILEAGLDLILERAAKRRGLVKNPRTATAPPTASRHRPHLPAAVQREVWLRDQGRCQFRLPSGEICGSTRRLELHHTTAYALGGGATADDLEVRCKPHNLHEARWVFGDAVMDRYTTAARGAGAFASPAPRP